MESSYHKEGTKNYLVFFDLDRTLASNNSGRELVIMAFRKGVLSYPGLIKAFALYLAHRLNLIDTPDTIRDMAQWTKDHHENQLSDLCREVALSGIIPSVFPAATSEIEFHRRNKAGIVLLSSALAPLCSQVALHLGLDSVICSDLEVSEGRFTGRPKGKFCYGEEKAAKLINYCNMKSHSPSSAWYYGDDFSDLPVLELVGNPVCVNPDRKLMALAGKKGWPVRRWTSPS